MAADGQALTAGGDAGWWREAERELLADLGMALSGEEAAGWRLVRACDEYQDDPTT